MKHLRKIAMAITLAFAVVMVTVSGSVSAGACGPPEPGQTQTPPCVQSPVDAFSVGQTKSKSIVNTSTDVIITEAAIGLLQSVLLIF